MHNGGSGVVSSSSEDAFSRWGWGAGVSRGGLCVGMEAAVQDWGNGAVGGTLSRQPQLSRLQNG